MSQLFFCLKYGFLTINLCYINLIFHVIRSKTQPNIILLVE